jgi:hypothetical protein
MMRHRSQDESLSLRLLADWELKVVGQQEHIAKLKLKGVSTRAAEVELKRLQEIVTGLRNQPTLCESCWTRIVTRVANAEC